MENKENSSYSQNQLPWRKRIGKIENKNKNNTNGKSLNLLYQRGEGKSTSYY